MLTRPRLAQIVLVVAFGVGILVLGVGLWAFLDMARMEQANPGPEFQQAAVQLRFTVAAEIVGIAILAALIVWRAATSTRRLALLAAAVWLVALFDLSIVGLAGAVPR